MRIIFLCYINRSGSTFLCQQLSRLQEIVVCPEADILADCLLVNPQKLIADKTRLIESIQKDPKFSQWNLNLSNLPDNYKINFELFKEILASYKNKENTNAHTIVFKAERLFQLMSGLTVQEMTRENIGFISLIRDIRAVYHSQLHTINPKTGLPFTTDLLNCAIYWNSYFKSISKHRSKIHSFIQYEKLIIEFPESIFGLVKEFGLNKMNFDYPEGKIYNKIQEDHKVIHKNVSELPKSERIEAWKNNLSKKDIILLEIASGKFLAKLDYTLLTKGKSYPRLYIIFILKWFIYKVSKLKSRIEFHIRKAVND